MKRDINLKTKIWEILEEHPELEEEFLTISPAFAKLKNPILRRTIAKITTLEQAASIAGIPAPELLRKLLIAAGHTSDNTSGNSAGHYAGNTSDDAAGHATGHVTGYISGHTFNRTADQHIIGTDQTASSGTPVTSSGTPATLAGMPAKAEDQKYLGPRPEWYSPERVTARFDAILVINSGNIPMSQILKFARALQPGEIFEFTTPFIPVPILDILVSNNYLVWSEKMVVDPGTADAVVYNRVALADSLT